MPKEFTKCVKNGGKVVTEKIGKDKYRPVCYDKQNNRFEGEVRSKKSKSRNKSKAKHKIVEESKVLLDELQKLQHYYNENYHNG